VCLANWICYLIVFFNPLILAAMIICAYHTVNRERIVHSLTLARASRDRAADLARPPDLRVLLHHGRLVHMLVRSR